MILQNALVYTPRHTFERGTLFIRNGRIVPFAAPEAGEEVIDAEGLYALPGLVDIHFHGAMGKDFCDGTEEAIQTLADFEASKGVLAICPATMTYPEEFLNHVMDAAAAHKNGRGADLVGINMEGPFISPKKVGAQNPEYVQGADAGMFRRLQKRAGGLIKLVDVAPEEPGNLGGEAPADDGRTETAGGNQGGGVADGVIRLLLLAAAEAQADVGGAAVSQQQGHGIHQNDHRERHVDGRHGGDPHALAHKDLVHDVVEAVDHQRQGRGDGVADDQLLNRLGFQRAAGLLIGRHTDPSSGGRTARRDKKSQRQSTALPTG